LNNEGILSVNIERLKKSPRIVMPDLIRHPEHI